MQLNPLIKNCFIERVYKSNNTFGKFPLEVKTHNIKDKRGSEIKWKLSKNIIGLVYSPNKTILYQWIYLHNCLS